MWAWYCCKMGRVERVAQVKRRRADVQRIVLTTVATAGLLAVMAVAPNALQVLTMFDGGRLRRKKPIYVVQNAFQRLLEKKHIVLEKTAKGRFARITPLGKHKLALMVAQSPDTRTHRRWDKRWRMVTYDIGEKRKLARDRLVRTLRTFGFHKLQNSVWVYPHDAEELITLIKADYQIGKEVLYAVVEHIENDAALRKHFRLH